MGLFLGLLMHQNYEQHFTNLADALYRQRENWQANAFRERHLNWAVDYPQLAMALDSLGDDELFELESSSAALTAFLKAFVPELGPLESVVSNLAEPSETLPDVGFEMRFFANHIPGRKWQQIQHFSQSCSTNSYFKRGAELIDWCCGKGHLGRYLAHCHDAAVTGLEWDESLVNKGNELSAGLSCGSMSVEHWDVLSERFTQAKPLSGHVVALHACGDLHQRLLQRASTEPLKGLSLAPCCYQKIKANEHQFISIQGQKTLLRLRRQDLHTIVQESVTAPASVRSKRIELQQWRLGFDLIQRKVRARDEYLNTPSLPQSALKLGFEGFCRLLAERKKVELPKDLDWHFYKSEGKRLFALARRRDLLRLAYRRPLELVLLFDQAAYLQEYGYQVELLQFCAHSLSPRNLLINARRD